jgi:hypothetical protein
MITRSDLLSAQRRRLDEMKLAKSVKLWGPVKGEAGD